MRNGKPIPRSLTAEEAHRRLQYDPATGFLTWRIGRRRGKRAGWVCKGYRFVEIDGEKIGAHRIIWLMMTGSWPAEEVDHRNRQKDENWWDNLREATHEGNVRNVSARRDSTTGIKGVRLHRGRWSARIKQDGKRVHLGCFSSAEAASAAYQAAASRVFGEFAA